MTKEEIEETIKSAYLFLKYDDLERTIIKLFDQQTKDKDKEIERLKKDLFSISKKNNECSEKWWASQEEITQLKAQIKEWKRTHAILETVCADVELVFIDENEDYSKAEVVKKIKEVNKNIYND